MSNFILRFFGKVAADSDPRYTDEYKAFLSSGQVCAGCGKTAARWLGFGGTDLIFSTATGEQVPILQAKAKAEFASCGKCGHRWKIFLSR